MRPLAVNPETGFLETESSNAFTSNQKVKFIELATELVNNKSSPNITSLSRAIGVRSRTVWEHLALDPKFKEAWEEVLDHCEATLVDVMYVNGQRPSGYMDRITWLRAHRPGRWNPDYKVTLSADSGWANKVKEGIGQVFEAEVVDNPVIKPATALQSGEKP